MTKKPGASAVLEAPIVGDEPEFLADLSNDNLVGALVQLMGEVYILRERVFTLEAELAQRSVLPEGAVEDHEESQAEAERKAADLAAYTKRVFDELARPKQPVSSIDPAVLERVKRDV